VILLRTNGQRITELRRSRLNLYPRPNEKQDSLNLSLIFLACSLHAVPFRGVLERRVLVPLPMIGVAIGETVARLAQMPGGHAGAEGVDRTTGYAFRRAGRAVALRLPDQHFIPDFYSISSNGRCSLDPALTETADRICNVWSIIITIGIGGLRLNPDGHENYRNSGFHAGIRYTI
jgi:hypothetical protein